MTVIIRCLIQYLLSLIKITSGSNPNEMFKDADVIVFIGGFPRKKGMERKDLLDMNKKIFI